MTPIRRLLSNKDFVSFVLLRLFLTLGIQMQMSTISLQIYYEYTKDELMLGLIGLAEAIPFILVSFYSGYLADKVNRKLIIYLGAITLLITALFLVLFTEKTFLFFHNKPMWVLYFVVVIFGINRAFMAAAMQPFLTEILPRELYTYSASLNSGAWHLGAILGPVFSGFIYSWKTNGALLNYITVAFLYSASIMCLLIIKHKGKKIEQQNTSSNNLLESIKEGITFVKQSKILFGAITLDLFAVLFGGVSAIIPAFTDKILHLGPEYYGLLRTSPAIGALVMSLLLSFYLPTKNAGKVLMYSVALFGVFTILFGISRNYWIAFWMLFLTGVFDSVSVVIRHSILQLYTPDHLRGRVTAINGIFIGSSNEIGAFESGLAARLMGLTASIIFGGSMTILIVYLIFRSNKELMKLDLSKV
ncbi:MAG TPA: MFS transporter [Bacteroidia bacterium]|nr:MFS transporter [Bacteroidia bacterium]